MSSFSDRLDTLKKMLIGEGQFSNIQTYFLDELGEDQNFIDSCKKAKHPLLKEILKVTGKQIFHDEVTMTHLMLLHYPKKKFYHGSCFLNGRVTSIIFFEDIDMGMIAITISFATGEMQYARFTSSMHRENPLSKNRMN